MRRGVRVGIACDVGQGTASHMIVGSGMQRLQSGGSQNEKNVMSSCISLSLSLIHI